MSKLSRSHPPTGSGRTKSILFVQTGDFRSAYQRLSSGCEETYRDQKRSVDFVSALSGSLRVTVLALGKDEYRTELAPGLWAEGLAIDRPASRAILDAFARANPTCMVLRTPYRGFLDEAARRGLPVLPSFADIFSQGGPRRAWWNYRMRKALCRSNVPCVSNHSLNASRSLVDVLRISPCRVVPWDWSKVPVEDEAKVSVSMPGRPCLFFAGSMTEKKGVGDCLDAVARLAARGLRCSLSLAGPGDLAPWRAQAAALGLADQVAFLGTISNAQVRREMRSHDFVIVPSRHDYNEGLPNTIYEALASRSVLVMSDHPAFRGRLVPDVECMVFAAGNPDALASCIEKVVSAPALYHGLSEHSRQAHDRLYVGMEWTDLVEAFIADPANEGGWVLRNALSSMSLSG